MHNLCNMHVLDRVRFCISRFCRRPPDVTCGAAILIPRWRRGKWRQPRPGAAFSIPIAEAEEKGGPSASGRHLGWPHLRNRKWGHPRWRPEAEGPPFSSASAMGIEKAALYYSPTHNSFQYLFRYYPLKCMSWKRWFLWLSVIYHRHIYYGHDNWNQSPEYHFRNGLTVKAKDLLLIYSVMIINRGLSQNI